MVQETPISHFNGVGSCWILGMVNCNSQPLGKRAPKLGSLVEAKTTRWFAVHPAVIILLGYQKLGKEGTMPNFFSAKRNCKKKDKVTA